MSVRKIVSYLISLLFRKMPTKRCIVFASYPDYSDNAYAIYKYAILRGLNKKWKLVWIVSQKERLSEISSQVKKDGENINVVYKYTIKGLWTYIRSRYAFETHSLFPYIKLRQYSDKHICLWHGMPLKKIGASIKGHKADSPNSDYTIAVSDITQKCMSEAFQKPMDRVLVLGQPRNDLLFEQSDFLDDIRFEKKNYTSIGIWLPTYRKSIVGDIRTDGKYEDGKISFLSIDDLESLNADLKQNNIFLFIKLHPMDALQLYEYNEMSNIRIIKPNTFRYQLYPLIGQCDFLMTDYSSVFIDYDILERPMAFVVDDIEAYKNSRGLYFEDMTSILPGPLIRNYQQLIDFIHNPKYIPSQIKWNNYKDSLSSKRVLEQLGLL